MQLKIIQDVTELLVNDSVGGIRKSSRGTQISLDTLVYDLSPIVFKLLEIGCFNLKKFPISEVTKNPTQN